MSKTETEENYEPGWGKRGPSGKRLGRPVKNPPVQEAEPEQPKLPKKRRIQDSTVLSNAIRGMAKLGYSIDFIANTVGVSKRWLRDHYLLEIKAGKEVADALVVENLYQQAMKDAPSAIPAGIYLTKARMGWTDKPSEENQRPQIVFDFSQMTYEERSLLMDRLKQKTKKEPDMIEGEVIDESTES